MRDRQWTVRVVPMASGPGPVRLRGRLGRPVGPWMFEESVARRPLTSLCVTVTVLAVLVPNMPGGHLRNRLLPVVAPYVRMTGLDQNWGVFAPPRALSAFVEARIDDADGTTRVVVISSRPGIESYVDYRWQKYGEWLRLDADAALWSPYARFLAGRERAEGRHPVQVALVRRWAWTRPPGPGPERGPRQEFTFFVVRL